MLDYYGWLFQDNLFKFYLENSDYVANDLDTIPGITFKFSEVILSAVITGRGCCSSTL